MEKLLSESERMELRLGVRSCASQECYRDVEPDDRPHDGHLIFEALHVLANGSPERLFAMLHKQSIQTHPDANAGRTYLLFLKIASGGVAVLEDDAVIVAA